MTFDGKTYTGTINDPEIEDALVSYGDFKSEDENDNSMAGVEVKANFWLLTGAGGGKVFLKKGEKESSYFVRPFKG